MKWSAAITAFLGLKKCAGNTKPNRGFCPMYFRVATSKSSSTLRGAKCFAVSVASNTNGFQFGAMMALFPKFQNYTFEASVMTVMEHLLQDTHEHILHTKKRHQTVESSCTEPATASFNGFTPGTNVNVGSAVCCAELFT